MTSPKEVPLTLRHAGRPPDEIDGLLRAFFRAELPEPWPVLRSPTADENLVTVRKMGRTWSMMRSRLALAASIGLLLIGCWLLSGLRNERPTPESEVPSEPTAELLGVERLKTPGGRDILIKGSLIREVEESMDRNGKPIRNVKPPKYRFEVQEIPEE